MPCIEFQRARSLPALPRIARLLAPLLALPLAPAYAAAQAVPGAGAPAVDIPRIDASIQVDGVLDEAVWQQAARLTDFWQYEPVDAVRAQEQTEVLVWYTADAIHFGIRALDSQAGSVRATRTDRDEIGDEDHVVLLLDTFDDRRRAFFFAVNALGVQMDGVRTEGAGSAGRTFGGNIDTSPDYVWQSAGQVTEAGWVAEVRVPFKSLSLPTGEPQRWGFQVVREHQRTGHTYTWTDARRASASFLAQSGALAGISDIERGVTLEAQPFLTAGLDGRRIDAAPVGSSVPLYDFERDDPEIEVGVNLHAGFGATSLDATINPDFSQVEADAARVTANERFALFFPEKRPFFLEGIELFSTPGQLVYTRRIVNPIAGLKATGKAGRLGYAALSALDDGSGGAGDALFTIARLRADFASNSLAGVVVTDRSLTDGSGEYNRVVAGDVRHVFRDIWFVQGQLGGSWTDAGAGSEFGEIWQLELDRTGHRFGLNYSLSGTAEDFVAGAGFVPRTGFVSGSLFNRLRWYGEPGAWWQDFTIFAGPNRLWEYGGSFADPIEGEESANFGARLRGGWRVDANINRGFVVLDPADYLGIEVESAPGTFVDYSPLSEVSGPGFSLGVGTPTWQKANAEIGFRHGAAALFAEGSEGTLTEADASVDLRPTRWLRVSSSLAYQRLERDRDGSLYARTLIPRVRAEVQPTRAFFFRAIAEWPTEERSALLDARGGAPLLRNGLPIAATVDDGLRVDLLASYEPTPGTVAFLGYGATLAGQEAFAFRARDLERTEDGFFLKLAYRYRW